MLNFKNVNIQVNLVTIVGSRTMLDLTWIFWTMQACAVRSRPRQTGRRARTATTSHGRTSAAQAHAWGTVLFIFNEFIFIFPPHTNREPRFNFLNPPNFYFGKLVSFPDRGHLLLLAFADTGARVYVARHGCDLLPLSASTPHPITAPTTTPSPPQRGGRHLI